MTREVTENIKALIYEQACVHGPGWAGTCCEGLTLTATGQMYRWVDRLKAKIWTYMLKKKRVKLSFRPSSSYLSAFHSLTGQHLQNGKENSSLGFYQRRLTRLCFLDSVSRNNQGISANIRYVLGSACCSERVVTWWKYTGISFQCIFLWMQKHAWTLLLQSRFQGYFIPEPGQRNTFFYWSVFSVEGLTKLILIICFFTVWTEKCGHLICSFIESVNATSYWFQWHNNINPCVCWVSVILA